MYIGELSKKTGVSVKAIRYYEEVALISPPKRKGKYRVFGENDVKVIMMIKKAQELGFSLKELKGIVSLKSKEGSFPLEYAYDLLDQKLSDISDEIKKLNVLSVKLRKFRKEFKNI